MLNFSGSKKQKKALNELEQLREENDALKRRLDALEKQIGSRSGLLDRLKEMIASIPTGARGVGSMMVFKDGEYQTVSFETKSDLQDLVRKVENKELELVFV